MKVTLPNVDTRDLSIQQKEDSQETPTKRKEKDNKMMYSHKVEQRAQEIAKQLKEWKESPEKVKDIERIRHEIHDKGLEVHPDIEPLLAA